MRQTTKRQLIEAHLGRPLEELVAERHRPYVPGHGWRQLAAEIRDLTGVDVTHETLRVWFADRRDETAA